MNSAERNDPNEIPSNMGTVPSQPVPLNTITRLDALLALGFPLFFTAIAFFVIPQSEEKSVFMYEAMAKNPYKFHEYPFGTRMLSPWLVHQISSDPIDGFRWLDQFSLFASGALLFLLFRMMNLQRGLALALLPAFYLAPTVQFMVGNPTFIDPMSYWLLLLVILGVLLHNVGLSMGALTLNTLNRPETLMVWPIVFLAWLNKDRFWKAVMLSILCAIPGTLIWVLMYTLWPNITEYAAFAQGAELVPSNPLNVFWNEQGFRALLDKQLWRELMPYLWGFVILGSWTASRKMNLICWSQIVLGILPITMASDYFRIPFYAFPGIFLFAAIGLQKLAQIHSTMAWLLMVICLIHASIDPFRIWPAAIEIGLILSVFFGYREMRKSLHKE